MVELPTVTLMSLPCPETSPVSSRNIKSGNRPWFSAFKSAALAVAGATLAANSLPAATNSWVGDASNLWNNAANWSGGLPANGDSLVFGAPGFAGVLLTDDIASLTIGATNTDGITFSLSAAGYTITRPVGGTQTLTAGTSGTGILIKDLSLFAQSLNTPIALAGDQTIQVGGTSGAFISGLTLQGAVTGASRLTKTGTGLLTLGSNSNSFVGLTINAGIVSIGADTNMGLATGSLIINGGALRTNIGSVTLNANRSIVLGGGTTGSGGTIQVSQTTAGTAGTTFNGVISNGGTANSLTKTGTGTLTLGGTNTYTGATKINQGQLTLAFDTNGAPVANIINSASALTLGGVPSLLNNTAAGSPILLVQGSNTAATSQTFNGLSVVGGTSSIVARAGTGASDTTLALGAITHVPGGTVGFSTLTNGSTGTGIITTTTENTNGILGGWATTAATGTTGAAPLTQTDWAKNDGTGKIVAYTGYTSVTGATPAISSNSASNLRIEGSTAVAATLAAVGTTDINTIQSTNTVAHSVAIGSGKTLRLGTYGGIWKTATTSTGLSITGGTLTAGGPTDNTAGEIVFNANGAASFNQSIAVSSVIANNGTGAVSVVKQGIATLVLTGANTYSGGTFINQGNLAANNALALGVGGVTVAPGATLVLNSTGGMTFANDLFLSGYAISMNGNTTTGTVTLLGDTVIQSGSTLGGTTSGKITGDYNVAFTNGMHTLTNTGNDNTGNTGINALTSAALNTLIGSNTGIKLGANEVIANGAGKGNLIIAASASVTGTLDMNGKTETINGLVSAGTAVGIAPLAIVTNTNAGTASTLTLGDNDQTATYAGTIVDGAGTVAITKIGAGTQTFSGANTYTGKTTVAAGTLLLSSSTVNSTIAGSTVIDVQSGATLNVAGISTLGGFIVGSGQQLIGNGTVVGNTTVHGNLAPGASPGALTFANDLTLTSTAVTTMEILGTSRGVAGGYDAINLGSTSVLTYDGNLILTMSGIIAGGTYDLFAFSTTALGAFDAISFGGGFYTGSWASMGAGLWTASSNGQDFSFSEVTGDLAVTAAIPEPSTWALLGLGLMAVVMLRRRCVA